MADRLFDGVVRLVSGAWLLLVAATAVVVVVGLVLTFFVTGPGEPARPAAAPAPIGEYVSEEELQQDALEYQSGLTPGR